MRSPRPGFSNFTTSAPISDSIVAAYGPARAVPTSKMRTPDNTAIPSLLLGHFRCVESPYYHMVEGRENRKWVAWALNLSWARGRPHKEDQAPSGLRKPGSQPPRAQPVRGCASCGGWRIG